MEDRRGEASKFMASRVVSIVTNKNKHGHWILQLSERVREAAFSLRSQCDIINRHENKLTAEVESYDWELIGPAVNMSHSCELRLSTSPVVTLFLDGFMQL